MNDRILVRSIMFLFWFFLLAGCSPDTPKKIPLVVRPPSLQQTESISEKSETQAVAAGTYTTTAAVDILFVIDNSGSMDVHQNNLSSNIQSFINSLTANANIDYHIGVITTDNTWDRGQLYGKPKFVTPQTPDVIKTLKKNLMPGINGDINEKVFDPLISALSPPLVNKENAGFYRPDAMLVLMIITDADDQSWSSPKATQKFLLDLKNQDTTKLATYGVLATFGQCPQDTPGASNARLKEFLRLMAGQQLDLCASNFGGLLSQIAIEVSEKVQGEVTFDPPPLVSTISVNYGTQNIPQDASVGWTYDKVNNVLVFGPQLKLNPQPAGTKLDVAYVPGVVKLQAQPVVGTVRLMYGTQQILQAPSQGWSYDGKNNQLTLDPTLILKPQPKGTTLEVFFSNTEIVLERRPAQGTLVVYYGSELVPTGLTTGWVYNPERNVIRIDSLTKLKIKPAPGIGLNVSYESEDYPPGR